MKNSIYDTFEEIGLSLIYHGSHNDRVYIMKIFEDDFDKVMERSEKLAEERKYGKIFAKISKKLADKIDLDFYSVEAEIPDFYEKGNSCVFLCRYYNNERKNEKHEKEIEKILEIAVDKKDLNRKFNKPYDIRKLDKKDSNDMAEIYKKVFTSYPFPIFDSNYLCETMDENIEYIGAFVEDRLIGIASAEKYPESYSAEMTDFAVLPEYRGNGIAGILLEALENELIGRGGYKFFYTIARALSYGMNITFGQGEYKFAGTLKNNTNISGSLESMNVWYKRV